jgi:hypothetical protein
VIRLAFARPERLRAHLRQWGMTEEIPWFVVVDDSMPARRDIANVLQFATQDEAAAAALHIARTHVPRTLIYVRRPHRWIMRTGVDNLMVILTGKRWNSGFHVYVGQQVR